MKQVIYTSASPPLDRRVTHEPERFNTPEDASLRGRLRNFVHYLGVATNVSQGTATPERATHTPAPPTPDPRATPEPETDDVPGGFNLLRWLKHFTLYLGVVTLVCLTGFYFLWQIPFLRDPSQLLRMVDDTRTARPLAARVSLPSPALQTQAAPSQTPVNTAITSNQPLAPTDTVVAVTSPPTTLTDPANPLPSLESQPATTPDSQAESDTPTTEPPAEPVPPPTPQVEIEQLLAEAQQQMDNRRFTAPASGNALTTYRRVLELQPGHPAALDGIQRITAYYQDVAQQSLRQGRLDESLAYINRGLRAAPKNDALVNLRRQVQQARQREQEAQQRALLEEMQQRQLEQARQEQLRRQQEQQPWWRQPSNYNDNSGFNQR